jgi:hypothetical protein
LETCQVSLNQEDNANRTKGGRPRVVQVDRQHKAILELLKQRGEMNSSGHLFSDRGRLPDRARVRVRKLAWTWRSLAWVPMAFVRPLPWPITRSIALVDRTIELPCWPLPTIWGITGPLSRVRVTFLLAYVQEFLSRAQNEIDVSISAHVDSMIA